MKFHEAYEKVKNGEYRFIKKGDRKFKLEEGQLFDVSIPHVEEYFTALSIMSDEWQVAEEILPENVVRDCDGNLRERRLATVYVHVYRNIENKEIFQDLTIDDIPSEYFRHEFVKTLHLSQQYSIPYERRTTN